MDDEHAPSELSTDGLDAVIFDLDGVITDTASVHGAAWKERPLGAQEMRS